ncbi:MAG: hypothetical protein V4591_10715 [Bdellovibrionota bacterium]
MKTMPGRKPSDWLCSIESNSKISVDGLYFISELINIFGKHRATISGGIAHWTKKLIGNVNEYREYHVSYLENNARLYRKISGLFLITLSKACKDYISKNYKL